LGELETISSRSKAAGTLQGRAGLQGSGDRNLHSLKTVPQTMAVFAQAAAAAKATGEMKFLLHVSLMYQKPIPCAYTYCIVLMLLYGISLVGKVFFVLLRCNFVVGIGYSQR
jgi:hypothetical protein